MLNIVETFLWGIQIAVVGYMIWLLGLLGLGFALRGLRAIFTHRF